MKEMTLPANGETVLEGNSRSSRSIASFSVFLKEKYDLHKLFLPKQQPINDHLTEDEMRALEELIFNRDHFEIRTEIAKRYEPGN